MVRGNLLPEAVTWFFTSVLKALQVHGEHQVCHNTLTNLAMLVYDNLVRLTSGVALIIASCVSVLVLFRLVFSLFYFVFIW